MQINDIDLQDLTPEELTKMLAKGSPKLVSAQASGDLVTLWFPFPHTEYMAGSLCVLTGNECF